MKFYQAEYEAMQFMKGSHTLKEWASENNRAWVERSKR